jgi:protein-S-isoprenylcysteine O-methyltransferase Ste14
MTTESRARTWAALGSALFFALAPGMVAGFVPWAITGWHLRQLPAWWIPGRIVGGLLLAAGAAVLLHAFARFVSEGLGTPAPVAPTRRLVVGGLYRYVRNPMYLAVLAAIVGQALLLGRFDLLWYTLAVGVAVVAFVKVYEEPTLTASFGAEYEDYRRNVPGWWPRWRPWVRTPERST